MNPSKTRKKKKKIVQKKFVFSLSLKKWFGVTFFALFIAALIRLPFFGQLPNGLNRDEAGLGYNAYSILKTGHDEYGKYWPISITSFGDQKLPGYVYTLIPFIAAFGLNPVAIRLPSLLSGFIVIVEMGIIAWLLGSRLRWSESKRLFAGAVVMVFLAISPWANHFSRVAYEAHLAMALFLGGYISYALALDSKKKIQQRMLLIISSALWSVTLLTYHSYQIFVPIFLFSLLCIDWNSIKKLDRKGLLSGIGVGCLVMALMFVGGIIQGNFVKNQGISPFHSATLFNQATQYRSGLPGHFTLYKKLFFNPFTEALVIFSQNLVSIVSGNFFFIHGSGHGDHDPGNMNNFHLFLAPLLFFGIFVLWERRKKVPIQRLVAWLLAGVVPAALTIQPQHEIRLSPFFPLLNLIGCLGVLQVAEMIHQPWVKKVLALMGVFILFFATIRMVIDYNVLVPQRILSNERYHVLARGLAKYQKTGLPVVTQSPTSSPYIWYVVENKYDPQLLLSKIEHYPSTDEGFIHVKRIDNVYFETVKWDDLYAWAKQQPIILVFKPEEIPTEQRLQPQMHFIENLAGSHGEVDYEVWKLDVGSH